MTVHPSQAPQPRPDDGGRMPDTFRPTPPSAQARADFARQRAEQLEETIRRAELEGNTARRFDLEDTRSKLLRRADQYERLAAWQAEHPEETGPKRVVDPVGTVVLNPEQADRR